MLLCPCTLFFFPFVVAWLKCVNEVKAGFFFVMTQSLDFRWKYMWQEGKFGASGEFSVVPILYIHIFPCTVKRHRYYASYCSFYITNRKCSCRSSDTTRAVSQFWTLGLGQVGHRPPAPSHRSIAGSTLAGGLWVCRLRQQEISPLAHQTRRVAAGGYVRAYRMIDGLRSNSI
jgi:hypothetical protein